MYTFNRFYTNPFAKHIDKLENLQRQLELRLSTGNSPLKITPEEGVKADEAIKQVQVVINTLRELDKRK
jgi:hypothetical protein